MSHADLAPLFHALFTGMQKAHGTYNAIAPDKTRLDGKLKGQAFTVRKPVTDALWEEHLKGKNGIGIIPIREDNSACFGAIDIDVYDGLDPVQIAAKLKELNLPLVVCRSKSGGVHVYLFARMAVSAETMQSKLQDVAGQIGHPLSELFPKQKQLASEAEALGGWINMPYFDADHTERYGVKADGSKLSAEAFLDYAEECKVDAGFFGAVTRDSGLHAKLAEILQGQRHKWLVGMAFTMRERGFGVDSIYAALRVENAARCKPPYDEAHLLQIARSMEKHPQDVGTEFFINSVSAKELLNMTFNEFPWAIENLLPAVGVSVLAARPKIGKSWMALQFSIAVASGRKAFGRFEAQQGRVLYLGLEDSNRRMKSRFELLQADDAAYGNIDLAYDLPSLNPVGHTALRDFLEAASPKYTLLVVDTFVAALGSGRKGKDPFRDDYEEIKELRAIAADHKISILLVHHTRKDTKDSSGEALDQVMGTTGVTAAADSIMVIGPSKSGLVMSVRGKDCELSEELIITLDIKSGDGWTVQGYVSEATAVSKERSAIIALLRVQGPLAPKEIAESLGKNRETIRTALKRMLDVKQVTSDGKTYEAANHERQPHLVYKATLDNPPEEEAALGF